MVMKFRTEKKKPILFCIVDNLDKYQSYDKFTPESDAFGVSTCDYFIHKDQIRLFNDTESK